MCVRNSLRYNALLSVCVPISKLFEIRLLYGLELKFARVQRAGQVEERNNVSDASSLHRRQGKVPTMPSLKPLDDRSILLLWAPRKVVLSFENTFLVMCCHARRQACPCVQSTEPRPNHSPGPSLPPVAVREHSPLWLLQISHCSDVPPPPIVLGRPESFMCRTASTRPWNAPAIKPLRPY